MDRRYRLIIGAIVAILLTTAGARLVGGIASAADPRQELAEKFVPIAMLKEQVIPCGSDGEPYLPLPVEAVLNDPQVELRKIGDGDAKDDPVIRTAPSAQDLAGLDDQYYLSFPGKVRTPGCAYETWQDERVAELGLVPTTYARIVTDPDHPGKLAIQYWFFYVFNLFNNVHESDWEMIQLTFDASTPEEALGQVPSALAFAQHRGGESALWTDDRVQVEGTHLIVYPGSGSHATYYDSATWVGWGEGGTGVGCDKTSEPLVRTELAVALIPEEIDPAGPYAWLLFGGKWGERQPWVFDGPNGPNLGGKWRNPFTWTEGIRDYSLAAPTSPLLGPGPADFFCSASLMGGQAAIYLGVHPNVVVGFAALLIILPIVLVLLNGAYVWQAVRLYFRRPKMFLAIGALMFPIGLLGKTIQDGVVAFLSRENLTLHISGGGILASAFGLGIGGVQNLLLLSIIGPMVILATWELVRNEDVSFSEVWRTGVKRFPRTVAAYLLGSLILSLLVMTVVGIPIALYKGVQWLYTPQEVTIEGTRVLDARHQSRRAVKGNWFRTLGMGFLVALLSGIPGPLIGTAALILGHVSMEAADAISGLVYAFAFPVAAIASTLWYLKLTGRIDVTRDGFTFLGEEIHLTVPPKGEVAQEAAGADPTAAPAT